MQLLSGFLSAVRRKSPRQSDWHGLASHGERSKKLGADFEDNHTIGSRMTSHRGSRDEVQGRSRKDIPFARAKHSDRSLDGACSESTTNQVARATNLESVCELLR